MANPILRKRADQSISKAINEGLKDKKWTSSDLVRLVKAAMDGGKITDVEFRDLKRFQRVKRKYLALPDYIAIYALLARHYPLHGPHVYPGNIDDLEGKPPLGSHQCAAIVQSSQPIGLTRTWREGIPVRGFGSWIKKGTAVATFEDGFYPNRSHGNHVAYYLGQTSTGIQVMDQWAGRASISSRTMKFMGKKADGKYVDPSNNGDALSVIMTK